MAMNGNPVFWADPSGADGVGGETHTSVFGMDVSNPNNTGSHTGYSVGATFGGVNLSVTAENGMSYMSTDRTERANLDSWIKGNESITYYGADARNVFNYYALANGYTRYTFEYFDSTSTDKIGLGIGDYKTSYNNDVRRDVVRPSFAKYAEVLGNTISVIELAHGSSLANFARAGAPAIGGVSSGLMIVGNTLGGIGIGIEYNEFRNNRMTGLEFGLDTAVAGTAIGASLLTTSAAAVMVGAGVTAAATVVAPFVAVAAIVYFGGKAIYEYKTNTTLFTKPK